MITIFKSLSGPHAHEHDHVSVDEGLSRIRRGESKRANERIAAEPDKEKRDLLKQTTLPAVCFCGEFTRRSLTSMTEHSGYIILDFDDYDEKKALRRKEKLKKDEFIYAAWMSPSRMGVKALVKIPKCNADQHRKYFKALNLHFNGELDISGSDTTRVCFESYDPDLYVNKLSETYTDISMISDDEDVDEFDGGDGFDFLARPPRLAIVNTDEIIQRIESWMSGKGMAFVSGQRNNYIIRLAGALNRFGIDRDEAISYCVDNYSGPEGLAEREIKTTVRSAYSDKVRHRTQYFEDNKTLRDIRRALREGEDKDVLAFELTISHNLPEKKAQRIVYDEADIIKADVFWEIVEEMDKDGNVKKRKINIVQYEFLLFLKKAGYYRFKPSSDEYTYVKVENNLVEEVDIAALKNYVFNSIRSRSEDDFEGITRRDLWEHMASRIGRYFNEGFLHLLPEFKMIQSRDTPYSSFFYYRNGVVEVTREGYSLKDYNVLNGFLWKQKILDRDFVPKRDFGYNEYSRMLELVSDGPMALSALQRSIGYLLHTYKDVINTRTVIMIDRVVSDDPEGGTGKGLIVNGIGNIRKVVKLNGKKATAGGQFVYQRVNLDTEVVVWDDIEKGFKFENLFSESTEGMTIEKKHMGEIFIPYEESAKSLILTNHWISGGGSSNRRRRWEVELENYFSDSRTPYDVFGRRIFIEWNDLDWNDFDNSMAFYCHLYLKEGVYIHKTAEMEEKNIISNTSPEFVEWARHLVIGEEKDRDDLLMEYRSEYPAPARMETSMRTFMKWLRLWAEHNEMTMETKRRGNAHYVTFEMEDPLM